MNQRLDGVRTAQPILLGELNDTADAAAAQALPLNGNPLHQVKARLQVCVGGFTLSVGELMALKQHQIVTLDRSVEHSVDIVLEGSVIARGQLVAVGEHFAVCITELPIALR